MSLGLGLHGQASVSPGLSVCSLQAHAWEVLTVSPHRHPGCGRAVGFALLCLCLAVSLPPFEQISLLHLTALDGYIFNKK